MIEANNASAFELLDGNHERRLQQAYAEFFEVFSRPLRDEVGDIASRVLLPPRAMHFDADDMALHCLAIHGHVRRRLLSSRVQHDSAGSVSHSFLYAPHHFRVITCHDEGITDWDIVSAQGIHHGPINAIDRQFDAAKEELKLIVSHPHDQEKSMLNVQFWPVSQLGTMEVSPDRLGWILDEHTSRQRQEQLEATVTPLGYTAIAS